MCEGCILNACGEVVVRCARHDKVVPLLAVTHPSHAVITTLCEWGKQGAVT